MGKDQRLKAIRQQLEGSSGPAQLKNVLNLDAGRVHPVGNFVLLEMQAESQSQGGIIMPVATQQAMLLYGRVREVGPDAKRCKAGDLVLVSPRDPRVDKVDVLLWLAQDEAVKATIDPKAESRIQAV